MKFVDEFRDAELGQVLAGEILATVEPGRHYKVMEVCGGHTHSIYKYGIDDLLPENVELVHGPGCPVCVIPMGRVDDGIAIAHQPGVIFTCFGDMMRVPGSNGTLLEAKAAGADVRMVYSPLDALRIAKQNPDREVVFFAIGFETTAPSTALTLKRAKAEGVANFSCVCNHVTIVPPLRALLDSPDMRLDGFIGPGHVCTVVGARPLAFIPADYGRPVVISGFEPLDILQSIQMILRQFAEGRCEVENQYKRVVPHEGNTKALEVMAECRCTSASPVSTPTGRAPARQSLMPLYPAGLCDAVNIAPGASRLPAPKYIRSVEASPRSMTSRPCSSRPSENAASSLGPEGRMSRATTTRSAPTDFTKSANPTPARGRSRR